MDSLLKNDSKIGAIIQARMSSQRLPGKILFSLPFNSEYTLLEQIIFRAKSINLTVILATSSNIDNDILEEVARRNDIHLFRGLEEDVLSRIYDSAVLHNFDVIIRLTGDNPCLDPQILEKIIKAHIDSNTDYTKTTGLPLGLNIEVFSFDALKRAYEKAALNEDREHVTSFFIKNPDQFKTNIIAYDVAIPGIRLTVDYSADYAFVCYIYEMLFNKNRLFGLEEILKLLKSNPWSLLINKDMVQHKIHDK